MKLSIRRWRMRSFAGAYLGFALALVCVQMASALSYGGTRQYKTASGASLNYVVQPTYWDPGSCAPSYGWVRGGAYTYRFDSSFPTQLMSRVDDEMSILNGTHPGYEPGWADVPNFTRVNGTSSTIVFSMADLGDYTLAFRSCYSIKFNKTGRLIKAGVPIAYCGLASSCNLEIGSVLAHEMGHMYGLWHTAEYLGPGIDLTIMSKAVQRSGWIRYGSCDLAALQARYGFGLTYGNSLSSCMPTMNLSGPAWAATGSSFTLTGTWQDNSTIYFTDTSSARAGAIDYRGINQWVHLFGITPAGVTDDLGAPYTCSGTNWSGTSCSWSITSFGSHQVFYIGTPQVTKPFGPQYTVGRY